MALFCPIMAMFFSKKVFYIFWKLCLVVGIILKQYLTPLFELYGSASTLSLNFSQKTTKNQLKWPFLSKNGNVFPKKQIFFSLQKLTLVGRVILNHYLTPWLEISGRASTSKFKFSPKIYKYGNFWDPKMWLCWP